jgi:hypothetical protein
VQLPRSFLEIFSFDRFLCHQSATPTNLRPTWLGGKEVQRVFQMLPGASRVTMRASAATGKPSTFAVVSPEEGGPPAPESKTDDVAEVRLDEDGVKVGNTVGIPLVHPSAHLMKGKFWVYAGAFYKACSMFLFFDGASRGIKFEEISNHVVEVTKVLKCLSRDFGMTKSDLAAAKHPAGHHYATLNHLQRIKGNPFFY